MSTPATVNLTIVQGDDWAQTFQLLTCDETNPAATPTEIIGGPSTIGTATFTPVNLAGCQLKSQMRRTLTTNTKTTQTLLGEFTVEFVDRLNGVFSLVLPSVITQTLTPNDNAADNYDIQVTDIDGHIRTYITGSISIFPDFTR